MPVLGFTPTVLQSQVSQDRLAPRRLDPRWERALEKVTSRQGIQCEKVTQCTGRKRPKRGADDKGVEELTLERF